MPYTPMQPRSFVAALIGSAAVGLSSVALSGCAMLGGGEENAQAQELARSCAKAASTDGTTPFVAIVRATGPADPATNESRKQALSKVIAGSTALKANLLLNGVNATPTPPNLRVNTQMLASGNNTLEREDDLKCKTNVVAKEFKRLDSVQAGSGVDLLSALRLVKNDVGQKTPREIHVVVLGSALQTKTIDLGSGDTLHNPAAAINQLAAAQLNFSCKGWRVYLVGKNLGKTGTPLNSETDAMLRTWWRAYFARCGGALVAWNTELPGFPLGPEAVEEADQRRIAVSVKRTPSEIVATVGGDLLFDAGSAELRSGAEQGLDRVLPLMGEALGPIVVTGHTDNTGTDAINDRLSRERAQTVAAWLERRTGLAADRFDPAGQGADEPVATNDTSAGRAKNRRVVVTIQIAKETF